MMCVMVESSVPWIYVIEVSYFVKMGKRSKENIFVVDVMGTGKNDQYREKPIFES